MFEFTTPVGGLAGVLLDGPREELFSIADDGKTRVFTIPTEVPPAVPLAYAAIKNRGTDSDTLVAWVLNLMLGEDALSALTNLDITAAQFAQVVAIVVGRAQGLNIDVPGATTPPKALRKPPATRKPRASSRASK
jgi:hypothetical protein